MKILIVSQYFYPENFRINDLALSLKNRGHEVSVFTSIPNYPKGEFYPGYGLFKHKKDNYNGIDIKRTYHSKRGQSGKRLGLNYLTFAFFGSLQTRFMKLEKYDVIYVLATSPITAAMPAIQVRKRLNIPLILNVQDLWPESLQEITKTENKHIIKFMNFLVNYIYKNTDHILTSSRSFIDKIKPRITNDKTTIQYFPQYSVVLQSNEVIKEFDKYQDNFNILFTGNHGQAQGLDLVVEAACEFKKVNSNIRYHLLGDGRDKERIKQLIIDNGVEDYVILHERVEEDLVSAYANSVDACLLILKPNDLFDMSIPAKMQTYMDCRKAILCCAMGESKMIVDEAKCGLSVEKMNVEELIRVSNEMSKLSKEELKELGNNGYKYLNEFFNKEKLIDQLEKIMRGK